MSDHDADRRLLLSEDATQQVWLDLETGEQVVVPVPHDDGDDEAPEGDESTWTYGPIMTAVRAWIADRGYKSQQQSPQWVVVPFAGRTIDPAVHVWCDEDEKVLRLGIRFMSGAPKSRYPQVSEAVQRLMAGWTRHPLLFDHEDGEVLAMYLFFMGDLVPTPAFLEANMAQVLVMADSVYATVIAVANGLREPEDAVAMAKRAQRLHLEQAREESAVPKDDDQLDLLDDDADDADDDADDDLPF
jgi:hypothetical protein